jgi:hypothetical protein
MFYQCYICMKSKLWWTIIKRGNGCKWAWKTIQFYTYTQIKVKEQYFFAVQHFSVSVGSAGKFKRQKRLKAAAFIDCSTADYGPFHTHFKIWVIVIIEDPTETEKCWTAKKYCSFTLICV